jgi:hypothetical protein
LLWSWRWPEIEGEITAVDLERIHQGDSMTIRLTIAYKFTANSDGPYAGESFWQLFFFPATRNEIPPTNSTLTSRYWFVIDRMI